MTQNNPNADLAKQIFDVKIGKNALFIKKLTESILNEFEMQEPDDAMFTYLIVHHNIISFICEFLESVNEHAKKSRFIEALINIDNNKKNISTNISSSSSSNNVF